MILVDAHVHIHDCFHLPTFLESAQANFETQAARLNQEQSFSGILLLTEISSENWFQSLKENAQRRHKIKSEASRTWNFHLTNETCSLWAECDGGLRMCLIAGRQITTAEDLEVLALVTEAQFEDGHSLEKTLTTVKKHDALPAIAWGVGKWIGKRGKILTDKLENAKESDFFLGDSGRRPVFWPRPYHLKLAESKGIRVLPGSDPLPFASESRRPGSFGFMVEASISPEEPAKSIKSILLDSCTSIGIYGSPEHPYRFFRNQLRMQFKKRLLKPKLVIS